MVRDEFVLRISASHPANQINTEKLVDKFIEKWCKK